VGWYEPSQDDLLAALRGLVAKWKQRGYLGQQDVAALAGDFDALDEALSAGEDYPGPWAEYRPLPPAAAPPRAVEDLPPL
jgi:hypothetical protein